MFMSRQIPFTLNDLLLELPSTEFHKWLTDSFGDIKYNLTSESIDIVGTIPDIDIKSSRDKLEVLKSNQMIGRVVLNERSGMVDYNGACFTTGILDESVGLGYALSSNYWGEQTNNPNVPFEDLWVFPPDIKEARRRNLFEEYIGFQSYLYTESENVVNIIGRLDFPELLTILERNSQRIREGESFDYIMLDELFPDSKEHGVIDKREERDYLDFIDSVAAPHAEDSYGVKSIREREKEVKSTAEKYGVVEYLPFLREETALLAQTLEGYNIEEDVVSAVSFILTGERVKDVISNKLERYAKSKRKSRSELTYGEIDEFETSVTQEIMRIQQRVRGRFNTIESNHLSGILYGEISSLKRKYSLKAALSESVSKQPLENLLVNLVLPTNGDSYLSSSGNGILLTEDGYILTAQHVVHDGALERGVVIDTNAQTYQIEELVRESEEYDLAIIKVNRVGDSVPTEIRVDDTFQYTNGDEVRCISLFDEEIYRQIGVIMDNPNSQYETDNNFCTSINLTHGFSGSPFVSLDGKLVGIATGAMFELYPVSSKTNRAYGLGVGTKLDPVMDFLTSYIMNGDSA